LAPRRLESRGESLGLLEHIVRDGDGDFHTQGMTGPSRVVKVRGPPAAGGWLLGGQGTARPLVEPRQQSARRRSENGKPPTTGQAKSPVKKFHPGSLWVDDSRRHPGMPITWPAKPLRRRPRIGPSPLAAGRCEGKGAGGVPLC
jgi:hypothetical protein